MRRIALQTAPQSKILRFIFSYSLRHGSFLAAKIVSICLRASRSRSRSPLFRDGRCSTFFRRNLCCFHRCFRRAEQRIFQAIIIRERRPARSHARSGLSTFLATLSSSGGDNLAPIVTRAPLKKLTCTSLLCNAQASSFAISPETCVGFLHGAKNEESAAC